MPGIRQLVTDVIYFLKNNFSRMEQSLGGGTRVSVLSVIAYSGTDVQTRKLLER